MSERKERKVSRQSGREARLQPRAAGGSRRRIAFTIALLLALGGSAYAAIEESGDPRFALSGLVISGQRHVPASVVAAAASLPVGENIWLLDMASARRRVEALPWVATAEISRAWPDRVTIRIRERAPAIEVVLPDGGSAEEPLPQAALVDASMHVLAVGPPDPEYAGLPAVKILSAPEPLRPGQDVAGSDVERAYDAFVQLRALGLRVSKVDITAATGITVTCADGVRVILGSDDDIAEKVSLYDAIAPKISAPRDVVYVDLRSVRAPTVLYR
jgi:cell division protein FtsQ